MDFNSPMTSPEMVIAGMPGFSGLGNADFISLLLSREASAHRYRKQFIERLNYMPVEIREAIKAGRLQMVDAQFYKTEKFEGSSVDVFQQDDDISIGISNVAKSRLEVNKPFVLSAIQLLYSTHATDAITNFDPVEYPAALKRGEISFRYNSKDVIDKMPVFSTFDPGIDGYDQQKPYGFYELKNPKIMLDDRIEFTIRLQAGQNLGAESHAVKVLLIGTTVKPY